jgi:hypothetical protein
LMPCWSPRRCMTVESAGRSAGGSMAALADDAA